MRLRCFVVCLLMTGTWVVPGHGRTITRTTPVRDTTVTFATVPFTTVTGPTSTASEITTRYDTSSTTSPTSHTTTQTPAGASQSTTSSSDTPSASSTSAITTQMEATVSASDSTTTKTTSSSGTSSATSQTSAVAASSTRVTTTSPTAPTTAPFTATTTTETTTPSTTATTTETTTPSTTVTTTETTTPTTTTSSTVTTTETTTPSTTVTTTETTTPTTSPSTTATTTETTTPTTTPSTTATTTETTTHSTTATTTETTTPSTTVTTTGTSTLSTTATTTETTTPSTTATTTETTTPTTTPSTTATTTQTTPPSTTSRITTPTTTLSTTATTTETTTPSTTATTTRTTTPTTTPSTTATTTETTTPTTTPSTTITTTETTTPTTTPSTTVTTTETTTPSTTATTTETTTPTTTPSTTATSTETTTPSTTVTTSKSPTSKDTSSTTSAITTQPETTVTASPTSVNTTGTTTPSTTVTTTETTTPSTTVTTTETTTPSTTVTTTGTTTPGGACNSNPCQNGGACDNTEGGFNCSCPELYEGRFCENSIHPCHYAPCRNGGTCERAGSSYQCTCTKQWKGPTCSSDNHPCLLDPCLNNGTCEPRDDGDFRCICTTETYGSMCENVEMDPCLSNPCKNGGTCQRENGGFNCICLDFYERQLCENDVTPTIHSVVPTFCPVSGGTVITVRGSDLLLPGPPTLVQVGPYEITRDDIYDITNTSFEVEIPPGNETTDVGVPLPIMVTFGEHMPVMALENFTYRGNPILTSFSPRTTIKEGGTIVTVEGEGLTSVFRAWMVIRVEVTRKHSPPGTKNSYFKEPCARPDNDTVMTCFTPPLEIPQDVLDAIAPAPISTQRRRRAAETPFGGHAQSHTMWVLVSNLAAIFHIRTPGDNRVYSGDAELFDSVQGRWHRERRQTEAVDGAINYNSENITVAFYAGFILDRYMKYSELLNVTGEAISALAQVTVTGTPKPDMFEQDFIVDTDKIMEITGTYMNTIEPKNYQVHIGLGECSVINDDITPSKLPCRPPTTAPGRRMGNTGLKHVVILSAGKNTNFTLGHAVFESVDIISVTTGATVGVAAAIFIIVACILRRRRRRRRRRPKRGMDDMIILPPLPGQEPQGHWMDIMGSSTRDSEHLRRRVYLPDLPLSVDAVPPPGGRNPDIENRSGSSMFLPPSLSPVFAGNIASIADYLEVKYGPGHKRRSSPDMSTGRPLYANDTKLTTATPFALPRPTYTRREQESHRGQGSRRPISRHDNGREVGDAIVDHRPQWHDIDHGSRRMITPTSRHYENAHGTKERDAVDSKLRWTPGVHRYRPDSLLSNSKHFSGLHVPEDMFGARDAERLTDSADLLKVTPRFFPLSIVGGDGAGSVSSEYADYRSHISGLRSSRPQDQQTSVHQRSMATNNFSMRGNILTHFPGNMFANLENETASVEGQISYDAEKQVPQIPRSTLKHQIARNLDLGNGRKKVLTLYPEHVTLNPGSQTTRPALTDDISRKRGLTKKRDNIVTLYPEQVPLNPENATGQGYVELEKSSDSDNHG